MRRIGIEDRLQDLLFLSALAAASTLLLVSLVAASAASEKPTSVNPDHPGYHLYRQYCGSCHGIYADGQGPAATALKKQPSDLTRLRERHGSPLPEAALIEIIDGREMVVSHGSREMPIWGERLHATKPPGAAREASLRSTLELILEYLGSIQTSRP